jgi:hypothetical protein
MAGPFAGSSPALGTKEQPAVKTLRDKKELEIKLSDSRGKEKKGW